MPAHTREERERAVQPGFGELENEGWGATGAVGKIPVCKLSNFLLENIKWISNL
jgi:hypothetical protein